MDRYSEDRPLITNRTVKKTRPLRANQKAAKKGEKRKGLFDFRTKIYKLVRAEPAEPLDVTAGRFPEITEMNALPADPDVILSRIHGGAVEGLSGSRFPSGRKIETVIASSAEDKYFIVNAVECDPALLHDGWLLTERWNAVALGIRAVCRCVAFRKVVVASRGCVARHAAETAAEIAFQRLDSFYPLGEEHILIDKVLGIRLAKQVVPAEQGILVLNVQTVLAIGQAAASGRTTACRYLTAADLTDGRARIVRAPFGADAAALLKQALGVNEKASAYIGGGAMGGHPMAPDELITAGTSCIAYAYPVRFSEPEACLGCGVCRRRCPVGLPVAGIVKSVRMGQPVPADIAAACLGCNACTYFCKAGIHTKHYMTP